MLLQIQEAQQLSKKDHLFKDEPWRNGNLGRISALTLEMDELWISKKSDKFNVSLKAQGANED